MGQGRFFYRGMGQALPAPFGAIRLGKYGRNPFVILQ